MIEILRTAFPNIAAVVGLAVIPLLVSVGPGKAPQGTQLSVTAEGLPAELGSSFGCGAAATNLSESFDSLADPKLSAVKALSISTQPELNDALPR